MAFAAADTLTPPQHSGGGGGKGLVDVAVSALTWSDAFARVPPLVHADISGWADEFVPERFSEVYVAFVFAVVWFFVRVACKVAIFPFFARLLGVKYYRKKRIAKFAYQMWLLSYYTFSSVAGYYVLRDEPFFTFPVTLESGSYLFNRHPYPFTDAIWWYYQWALGFYIAELFAIFMEPKRSDFLEYVLHHAVTIALVGGSFVCHQHRIGAYILFIHDIPDIFLCAAKSLHYVCSEWMEVIVNANFALFVGFFIFFRLYCLPYLTWICFCVAPFVRPASYNQAILSSLFGVALQGLHIFWFVLIIRMIIRLIMGVKGDMRSDEEEDPDAVKPSKSAASKSSPSSPSSKKAK